MSEAAEYMRENGLYSQRTNRDEIRRWLPGLAYEDLVGRTGPGYPRRDGRPRRLRHILSLRHLSDRLRKVNMDTARIYVEAQDGEELRGRRVHSRDPETLEALADVVGASVVMQLDCLLTEAAAFANLSEEESNEFNLHAHGYSQEDNATQTRLSQATVSRRLKSIMGRIKKNIGKINIY